VIAIRERAGMPRGLIATRDDETAAGGAAPRRSKPFAASRWSIACAFVTAPPSNHTLALERLISPQKHVGENGPRNPHDQLVPGLHVEAGQDCQGALE
jgi:hypothetical protein